MNRELTLKDIDEAISKIPRIEKIHIDIPITALRTLQVWEMMLTIPRIEFPEPESLWHYRFRKFKEWTKELPSKIRWALFPYHIIHKDDFDEMFD